MTRGHRIVGDATAVAYSLPRELIRQVKAIVGFEGLRDSKFWLKELAIVIVALSKSALRKTKIKIKIKRRILLACTEIR